jgi:hypothetical protein
VSYEEDLIARLDRALAEARAVVAEIEEARRAMVLDEYARRETERLRGEVKSLRNLVDMQSAALALRGTTSHEEAGASVPPVAGPGSTPATAPASSGDSQP